MTGPAAAGSPHGPADRDPPSAPPPSAPHPLLRSRPADTSPRPRAAGTSSRPRAADVLLVATGGALGGPARYGVEALLPAAPGAVPWGTLTVNLVGALLLGVLVGAGGWGRPSVLLVAGTGFLGAFTTFSTWMVELVQLAEDGHAPLAASYLVGALALGLVAAAAGVRVGQRLRADAPGSTEDDEDGLL